MYLQNHSSQKYYCQYVQVIKSRYQILYYPVKNSTTHLTLILIPYSASTRKVQFDQYTSKAAQQCLSFHAVSRLPGKPAIHTIYIRTVSSQRMLPTLLNQIKLVYGPLMDRATCRVPLISAKDSQKGNECTIISIRLWNFKDGGS